MRRTTRISFGVALVILLVAVGTYFLLSVNHSATTNTASTVSLQSVLSLAYAHWTAIGNKNVSLLMSQYSSGYEAVWFFINGSSVGPTNGRYDCNITRGVNNCNYFPAQAWSTLFNKTGDWTYKICNANISNELDQRIVVHATVWFFMTPRNETLMVPYEMDFQYYNDTWAVWKDWFGMAQQPAVVTHGIEAISCS